MGFFESIWNSIVKFFTDTLENSDKIIISILSLVLIFFAARIVIKLCEKLIRRALNRKIKKFPHSLAAKKSETLITLLNSVTRYLVYFFAVAGMLGVLGLSAALGSMLTTAGIGGIAIGLGAQAFIKDVVSGFFLLFEDQFAVGDYVRISDICGKVDNVALRTTRIRMDNNEFATIPNGMITVVINYTRDSYLLFYDAQISREQDPAAAIQVMLEAGSTFAEQDESVVSGPIPIGVSAVLPDRITLRMNFYVKPLDQWRISRALNKIVLDAFRENGIIVPNYDSFVVNPGVQ